MTGIVMALDASLAWLAPAGRAALWGMVSAAISMAIYARLSPQEKLRALQAAQKAARSALKSHDGDFSELKALIGKDLKLALKILQLALLPFTVSLLPVLALAMPLLELYQAMEWFMAWYAGAMVAASLAIKFWFRIA